MAKESSDMMAICGTRVNTATTVGRVTTWAKGKAPKAPGPYVTPPSRLKSRTVGSHSLGITPMGLNDLENKYLFRVTQIPPDA